MKKQWDKESERGEQDLAGEKGEKESLLVGGIEYSCQRIPPSQSTLHIIM